MVDRQPFAALDGIDLSMDRGEFVAVLGPSGCGKSTLLNIIAGLDTPTGGELLVEGKPTRHYRKVDWDLYRRFNVGFVFQNFNLVEHLNALENVELPLSLIGMPKGQRVQRAAKLLEQVGLTDFATHRPAELSGGQQQRVAIARALANDPDIILADEPTGSLDQQTGLEIMELLKSVAEGKLVVLVTHNQQLARDYSQRIVHMLDGRITKEESFESARTGGEGEGLRKRNSSMSLGESFKLSLRNMRKKLGRVAITAIAGCIGIAGIALVLGLSNGATAYIDAQLNRFATANILTVQRTYSEDDQLVASDNVSDFDHILELDGVVSIRPAITLDRLDMFYDDNPISVSFQGLAAKDYRQHLAGNYQGALPQPNDYTLLANEALARAVIKAMGMDPDSTELSEAIGQQVTLVLPDQEEGTRFTISGVAGEFNLGNPTAYYDYENFLAWLSRIEDEEHGDLYSRLTVGATSFEVTLAQAADNMDIYQWIVDEENGGIGQGRGGLAGMVRGRGTGISATSFAVMFKNIFSQMLALVQTVLLFFVACALVVSCIMTAIVLYAGVLERKTEIGIIKAVGGSNRDVIRIFQSEAALIGLLAGMLGLAVAGALQPLLNRLIDSAVALEIPAIIRIPLTGIPFTGVGFPLATVVMLLAISVGVAVLAGRIPSRRATRMAVVDALRDE